MSLERRVENLERETTAQADAALDARIGAMPGDERAALIAALRADLGRGPAVDADTAAKADAGFARLWAAMAPAELALFGVKTPRG